VLDVIALRPESGPLTVLAIGAHPDDVEIGCGGTLLAITSRRPVSAHVVVLTGSDQRRAEAEVAAAAFLAEAETWQLHTHTLPDGRLPAHWEDVKNHLEQVAAQVRPDVVLAPRLEDAHQDHRLLARMVTTVWRDSLVLHYEIPKWDGDLHPVTHYVPVDEATARRKCELLDQSYPSQRGRDWWGDETILGLMRMRGVECRARYAEGFVVRKAVLDF
jgi:LmbE family N-acetylglucosaminyl deacetylase